MHEEKLNLIFAAIKSWDGAATDAYDPKVNSALKEAVKAAKKVAIPETLCQTRLGLRKAGSHQHRIPNL
jgi:ribonucleoside-diphosphate reductase alpha chain